jgi:hypothetical protein
MTQKTLLRLTGYVGCVATAIFSFMLSLLGRREHFTEDSQKR